MNRSVTRLHPSCQLSRPLVHLFGLTLICLANLVSSGCNQTQPTESATPGSTVSPATAIKTFKTTPSVDTSPGKTTREHTVAQPIEDQPAMNDPAFHAGLVQAIDDYLEYPLVNSVAIEAPADCRPPNSESRPMMSHSDHESTHGRKLYYLFVKDITHYLSQDGTPSPEGQVLVKESWTSKASNPGARNMRNHASGARINPRLTVGDEVVEIGKRQDLFVMMKLAADTANTDQGWVYGVIDPNTEEVIASGKVSSCMRCHEDARNDRLFGPAFGQQPLAEASR